jgi:hypothetical protein
MAGHRWPHGYRLHLSHLCPHPSPLRSRYCLRCYQRTGKHQSLAWTTHIFSNNLAGSKPSSQPEPIGTCEVNSFPASLPIRVGVNNNYHAQCPVVPSLDAFPSKPPQSRELKQARPHRLRNAHDNPPCKTLTKVAERQGHHPDYEHILSSFHQRTTDAATWSVECGEARPLATRHPNPSSANRPPPRHSMSRTGSTNLVPDSEDATPPLICTQDKSPFDHIAETVDSSQPGDSFVFAIGSIISSRLVPSIPPLHPIADDTSHPTSSPLRHSEFHGQPPQQTRSLPGKWSTSASTPMSTTRSAGVTLPPSPASTVIPPSGRCAHNTPPPPLLRPAPLTDTHAVCSLALCVSWFHPSVASDLHPQHQTGLCVYEADDPATRGDPNIDEVPSFETGSLNWRVTSENFEVWDYPSSASLPHLTVVFHTGKPHPRWADNRTSQTPATDSNNLSEKWYTRTLKKPVGAGLQQLTIKTKPKHSPDHLSPHRRPRMCARTTHDGHYLPSSPLPMVTSSAGSSSSPPRDNVDLSCYTLQMGGAPTGLSCRCSLNPTATSQMCTLT